MDIELYDPNPTRDTPTRPAVLQHVTRGIKTQHAHTQPNTKHLNATRGFATRNTRAANPTRDEPTRTALTQHVACLVT